MVNEAVSEAVKRVRRRRKRREARERRRGLQRLLELAKREPERAARESGHICEHCGEPLLPDVRGFELPWDEEREQIVWPDECGCEASQEARAKELREQQEQERREAWGDWEDRLQRAGLVGWLSEARFVNFEPRDDFPGAMDCKQQVQEYADALLGGKLGRGSWLIMYGGYGTGKSHLAAAIIREALESGWQAYFRVWTEYLKRLQASWDHGTTEATSEIEAELARGKLVVIDDIDKRRPTGWTREVLFTALNRRYNSGLPTVLTFNYGPDDRDSNAPGRLALEEYLGRATLDRLLEVSTMIEFNGPSYRSGVRLDVR